MTRITQDRLRLVVALIAVATVVSGLVQLVAPGFVLETVGADATATSRHFFAIVGMFMAIVGALTLHALASGQSEPIVILWGAVQKLGASAAVGLGVARGIFGAIALAIAAFDLVSAAVMARLWQRLRG